MAPAVRAHLAGEVAVQLLCYEYTMYHRVVAAGTPALCRDVDRNSAGRPLGIATGRAVRRQRRVSGVPTLARSREVSPPPSVSLWQRGVRSLILGRRPSCAPQHVAG
ncbi:hypothetical protein MTO96_000686 [Rhipicephalus appendiculatus]